MVVTCESCLLRQFVPISGTCRRCNAPLIAVIEIPIVDREFSPTLILGPALHSLRLRSKESQAGIGLLSRTSRTHISRIESGTVQPNLSTLARLLRAFGVSRIYVFIKENSR
jgi:DNA-binding XRE family transcriptional regulator